MVEKNKSNEYDDKKIFLDLPGECLDVSFEIDEDEL